MRLFIASFFIWWRGQTVGTNIFTLINGIYVGSDDRGNKYFKSKKDLKRWVHYHKECDASSISPEWHGWIHGKVNTPPSSTILDKSLKYDLPNKNMTGTIEAYHPQKYEKNLKIKDYTSWKPQS